MNHLSTQDMFEGRIGSHERGSHLVNQACVGPGEVFVVGGGEIYRQTIGLASRLELTEIAASPQAEVFFPEVDDGWREVQRTPREGFDFVTYEREPHRITST